MKKACHRLSKYAFGVFVFILSFSCIPRVGDVAFLGAGVAEAESIHSASFLSRDHPLIRAAVEVQNRYTEVLMNISGVVGTATGIGPAGQPVIKVFTAWAGIPGIPLDLEGIPVKVEITGRVVALSDPTARFARPVPIGVSTGHPDITAGTIGCRVVEASGSVYALSNNHIYADGNEASPGDSALQPGPVDGGRAPVDEFGTLYDFEPIVFSSSANNTMDAAIAASWEEELGCSTPSDDGYGTPRSTTEPASLGLLVKKYGRTTGLTHGEVSGVDATVDVCYECGGFFCNYCTKSARFVGQIAITSTTGNSFSAGGDSGSLIVTESGNKPVGLLFAGSSSHTFANAIDPVLSRFGVTVDDCSTPSGPSNDPPTADFTYSTTALTVEFTDTSTDSDGTVVAWNWDFGDGATSTLQNPTHTYALPGDTYTVTLTATDSDGVSASTSQDVVVSAPPGDSGVSRIDIRVERTWSLYRAVADVHTENGTRVEGSFSFNGRSLNNDNDVSVGGTASLMSRRVWTTGAGGVFTIEITSPGSGVSSCSVSVAEGTNTCP